MGKVAKIITIVLLVFNVVLIYLISHYTYSIIPLGILIFYIVTRLIVTAIAIEEVYKKEHKHILKYFSYYLLLFIRVLIFSYDIIKLKNIFSMVKDQDVKDFDDRPIKRQFYDKAVDGLGRFVLNLFSNGQASNIKKTKPVAKKTRES